METSRPAQRTTELDEIVNRSTNDSSTRDDSPPNTDTEKGAHEADVLAAAENTEEMQRRRSKYVSPYDRWIVPVQHMWWSNPMKWWGWFKFLLLRGVFIDAITHDSALLRAIHAKAHRYDVRVEHLWTYCQVVSAMLMSIAHGSNGE